MTVSPPKLHALVSKCGSGSSSLTLFAVVAADLHPVISVAIIFFETRFSDEGGHLLPKFLLLVECLDLFHILMLLFLSFCL